MGVYKGVTTSELDELAAETAAHLTSLHPDFGVLAARISVSNLHKSTKKSFSETASILYNYVEPKTGKKAPMLADDVFTFIMANAEELNAAIVYDRDMGYDYFGFKVRTEHSGESGRQNNAWMGQCAQMHFGLLLLSLLFRSLHPDSAAQLPSQSRRQGGGATAAHAHARVVRYSLVRFDEQ